jgi:hypothetical protein
VPQSFKMVLPSTNTEPASNSVHSHNAVVIPKDWPSLPESSSMKRESSQAAVKGGGGESAMNTHEIKGFQISNEFQCGERAGPTGMTKQQGPIPNRVMIVNSTNRAWFYPSKGLNVLFSRTGKIASSNSKPPAAPNPRPKPPQEIPLDSQ